MFGSPSQRLRATLYLSWERNTNRKENFDDYYQWRMERIINNVKKELEPPVSAYDEDHQQKNQGGESSLEKLS
jgi:hypothetical protein